MQHVPDSACIPACSPVLRESTGGTDDIFWSEYFTWHSHLRACSATCSMIMCLNINFFELCIIYQCYIVVWLNKKKVVFFFFFLDFRGIFHWFLDFASFRHLAKFSVTRWLFGVQKVRDAWTYTQMCSKNKSEVGPRGLTRKILYTRLKFYNKGRGGGPKMTPGPLAGS